MDEKPIRYIKNNDLIREISAITQKYVSMFGYPVEGNFGECMRNLTELLLELNPNMKLSDISRAFRNAVKGQYGAVYKLTTHTLYRFVSDYFSTQGNKVNCQNIEEEMYVERDRLQDAKSFMRHMYDFHTSGRRIFGGWHYAYDTMLGHGWLKDEDLAAEMDNAYETLKENLQQQKYMNPHQRHSIDREIAELADYSNKTLQDKAKEIACRKVFDYWKEQGVTPDAVYANVNKVCY